MAYYADDIRRIAKQKEPKGGLKTLIPRPDMGGNSKDMLSLEENEPSGGPVSPLTLNILTYDDDEDVDFKDTSNVTHTLKTAATAEIVDANGTTYEIEEITYAAP